MLKQFVIGAALLAGLSHAAPARAQAPPAAQPPAEAPKPNNYADPKSWLCRPGSHDACDIDETATVVAADGTLTRETWKADPNAAIDCFYVYPTISTDPGQNSDMIADPAEINVVKQQFARFSSKCRPYAPLYRQITLVGLRKVLANPSAALPFGEGVQYDDVRDAWNYYLKNDNKGRGVVLVGHSQGSFILIDLIKTRDRRQADPVEAGVRDPDGDGGAGAEGEGCRRRVPEDPALPHRVADRMPDHVRVVPLDGAAARQHAVRQSA